MKEAPKAKNKSLEAPKKKLERLIVISSFIIGYLYIYIYQTLLHIKVKFIEFRTLIQMPLITLLIFPLILYLYVKSDPLQRKPSQRKPIKFFQNEFPSKYILKRCERCIEDEKSCPNYIKAESYDHIKYWFHDIFHGAIENENPQIVKDTFEKGYICKLVYYFSWTLFFFSVLGILTIVFHHFYLYIFDEFKFQLSASQIFFPLALIVIVILIKSLNKADEKSPSGCWQAWREINRINVSWLRSHEDFLVQLICRSGLGTKRFRENDCNTRKPRF